MHAKAKARPTKLDDGSRGEVGYHSSEAVGTMRRAAGARWTAVTGTAGSKRD